MLEVYLRNRQRTRTVNLKLLQSMAQAVADECGFAAGQLGVLLVSAPEMTRLNERFLQHAGPTDVIAFDYAGHENGPWRGEVFICVEEAVRQARRFGTVWPKEVVRYLVHGLLHLRGEDDTTPSARARMKAVENAMLRRLTRRFPLARLSSLVRRPSRRAGSQRTAHG